MAAVALTETQKMGKVTQVIGPVVDVEFPPGALPEIYTALTLSNVGISSDPDNLTVEVAQHLGENTARCIAMDSTEGLVRGQPVKSTGAPISVPVGKETPGARARVALSALTMAEFFRDEVGRDMLLFIDNIFPFTQAGSEVSALLGRIPSAVGYQPTLANEMGELQERITSTKKGAITSVQAIYVPADDLTDPAPATTFAHLDATTVLSRGLTEIGIYPAVDPPDSTTRILDAQIVGERHYKVARRVQPGLQRYKELQDTIPTLGLADLSATAKLTVTPTRQAT